MRLIGNFDTEKQAYAFYSFLLKEGIQNIYEPFSEQGSSAKRYRIWVYDEDDLEKAMDWIVQFKEHPEDPRFQNLDAPLTAIPPTPEYSEISESEELKWSSTPPPRIKVRKIGGLLTNLILLLCGFLFFYNDLEEARIYKEKGELAMEISLTPLQQSLLFDYPDAYRYLEELVQTVPLDQTKELKDIPPEGELLLKKAEETPSWKGLLPFILSINQSGWKSASQVPMFEKIQKGQLWRLFTPCLLHRDFLHILFNMIWAWILIRQIEERIPRWKVCLLMLCIGIIANCAQYLVSGPNFIGFSGVVVGLAGFIWMRQRRAPWEGYPLQKSTILFLLFFVLSMFALELITFSLQLFSVIQITPIIANTAHIVGGVCGILLGRFSFFSRRVS